MDTVLVSPGNSASDHEDDPKFHKSMGKSQYGCAGNASPGQWKLN
jgi:hypothetical protein